MRPETRLLRLAVLSALFFCLGGGLAQAASPAISAGFTTSSALKKDGTMWTVGNTFLMQPTRQFPAITDAVSISSQGATIALRANGELWSTGQNGQGQTGDGTTAWRTTPYKALEGVSQFSAWNGGALAVKSDGSMWAWGDNTFGQLGDGSRTARLVPVRVNGPANVVMVAAGGLSGAALTADGHVWVWGSKGAIADGDTKYYSPDDPNGVVLSAKQIPNLSSIVSIRSGNGMYALDASGRLWSFGASYVGLAGNGSPNTRTVTNLPEQVPLGGKVIAFDAGWQHTLAVTEDGAVWGWGASTSGKLGIPGAGIQATPIKIELPGPALAVSAGWLHSAVLLADGRVMTWGGNSNGQLGRALFQSDYAPGFMVAETGTGEFSAVASAPVDLGSPPTLWISSSSAVGASIKGYVPFTAALTASATAAIGHSIVRYDWASSDGTVRAQGTTVSLGFTNPGAVDVYAIATDDSGMKAAALQHIVPLPPNIPLTVSPQIGSSGGIAVNTLSNTGCIYSWGAANRLGFQYNLGTGPYGATPVPVDPGLCGIVKIATSNASSFAITEAGLVLAWGMNDEGASGTGSTAAFLTDPGLVRLPKVAIDIVGGNSNHAFGLLNDGTVWAWGGNAFGQLGLADTMARSQPEQVPGLSDIVSITAGDRNGYAIDRNGGVWAWGDNTLYQLGQGDNSVRLGVVAVSGLPPIAKVAAGIAHVLLIAPDGRVFGWSGWNGLLGDTSLPNPVKSPVEIRALAGFTQFVSGSGGYTLGVKADGSVWTWGSNWNGQIPGSTNANESRPIPVPVPAISAPRSMTVSNGGGAAVLADGSVVTWGLNDRGQIGDGTFARRNTPSLVVNQMAAGFLDLMPGSPKNIPPSLMPPFLVKATLLGSNTALTFGADVHGLLGSPSAGAVLAQEKRLAASPIYNVYVAAYAGSGPVLNWYQLDANHSWGPMIWPIAQFMSGINLSSNQDLVSLQILDNLDVSSLIGSHVYVGYGTTADEMLNAGRYREVLTIQ